MACSSYWFYTFSDLYSSFGFHMIVVFTVSSHEWLTHYYQCIYYRIYHRTRQGHRKLFWKGCCQIHFLISLWPSRISQFCVFWISHRMLGLTEHITLRRRRFWSVLTFRYDRAYLWFHTIQLALRISIQYFLFYTLLKRNGLLLIGLARF